MKKNNKLKRNDLFYSEKDFQFESEIGMDYINQDINQTILLYKINRQESNLVDLYNETIGETGVSTFDPIELNVIFEIENPQNKAYDGSKGTGRYLLSGNLNFHVYNQELLNNKTDIDYGDYIGVQVDNDKIEFFTVINDGKLNFDNKHLMYGTKSFYRSITCTPTDKDIFNDK